RKRWSKGFAARSFAWSRSVSGEYYPIMPDVFQRTQEALFVDSFALGEAIRGIRKEQEQLSGEQLASARTCLRVLLGYQWKREGQGVGSADFLVLVRQIARYSGLLHLPSSWWQTIAAGYEGFGLEVRSDDGEQVRIAADDWLPGWLPYAAD